MIRSIYNSGIRECLRNGLLSPERQTKYFMSVLLTIILLISFKTFGTDGSRSEITKIRTPQESAHAASPYITIAPNVVHEQSGIDLDGNLRESNLRYVNEYNNLTKDTYIVSCRTAAQSWAAACYDETGNLIEGFISWTNPAKDYIDYVIEVPEGTVTIRLQARYGDGYVEATLKKINEKYITQKTGDSMFVSMSQRAVTEELDTVKNDINRIYGSIYVSTLNMPLIRGYNNIIIEYDKLVNYNSEFVSKVELGQTNSGYSIYEYIFSTGDYNKRGARGKRDALIKKPKVLIQAGIHGREKSSVMSTLTVMKELVENNLSLGNLKNFDIHVIPCLNPWGYDNNRRWNHNRVDLNRNYDAEWKFGGEGTSNYSGEFAASESETQISQNWMNEHSDAVAVLDFHNSYIGTEASCLSRVKDVDGEDELLKTYLMSVYSIHSITTKIRKANNDIIMGYVYRSNIKGSTATYLEKIKMKGGTLETPMELGVKNGTNNHNIVTIASGADVLGNILLGFSKKYNILNP